MSSRKQSPYRPARLYQASDCDQSVLPKFADNLLKPCPKNSRNSIQEILAPNICLTMLALCYHPSYSVAHILTQNYISLKFPSHFCRWKTWSKAMERLVRSHTEQEAQQGAALMLWHHPCKLLSSPSEIPWHMKEIIMGRGGKTVTDKVAQHVLILSYFKIKKDN